MRDPREYADALAELTVEAQHRMRPEPAVEEPQPVPGPRYTAPVPPPADLGFDLAKWNRMSRAERRAVLRYAKKRGK